MPERSRPVRVDPPGPRDWPYATTVFDYVRQSMPFFQPHSLTDSEVYAVTAYLLNLNGIIGENRDNFILVHPWTPGAP